MAYDEGLAERIRGMVEGERGVTEKQMFGGVAFLLDGKMFVGIVKDELMARIGPAAYDAALGERGVREMDFAGRPMAGYVFVAPAAIESDDKLERWVRMSAAHVRELPAKKPKAAKPAKKPAPAKKAKPAARARR